MRLNVRAGIILNLKHQKVHNKNSKMIATKDTERK